MIKFKPFLNISKCNNSLMRGLIDPTKKISFQDHKLEYSREELRKVVTVIVEKFVAL